MSQANMSYDHPQYLVRQSVGFAALTPGSAATSSKFIAFANLQIKSVTATLTTSGGTSTTTAWNGTATVTAVGAQTYSVIRIGNIAAAGSTPSLSTATYGPFALSLYNGTSTGTQTNSTATGLTNNVALYGTATTGTAQAGTNNGAGGFSVNQGDQLYIVQGTEATATGAYALEYSVTPLASVTN
jgi:hypothetical protein